MPNLNLEDCEDIIESEKVKAIYENMEHHLVNSVNIQEQCVSLDKKTVNILMYNNSNEIIFSNDNPMMRIYENNKSLVNELSLYGKVVTHKAFFLKPQFRRQGLAKRVYKREFGAYKAAGFNQVFLEAVADGIMTWSRSPFNFTIIEQADEDDIISLWRQYVKEVFTFANDEDYCDIIKNKVKVQNLSKEYVIPSGRISFADWYYNRNPYRYVPMYKNIEQAADEEIEDIAGENNAN